MGFNKLTLQGSQICDYLYVEASPKSDETFDYNRFTFVNSEPQVWGTKTLFSAKFEDDGLIAGNSSLLRNISGYELRRRRGSESYSQYVAKIPETDGGSNKFVIDYAVANKNAYTYYLFPSSSASEESGVVLSPSVTEEVTTDWGYWTLMIVDESDEDNVYYLNKMFKFELNVALGDISNNAVINVIPNFTKYPTVQYGTSNYRSGELSALCGFISCDDTEYIETPNMISELLSITSDNRKMFLKDIEGNMWEVKITSPISISTNNGTIQKIKTVKFVWTEVGEAKDISIINNPNKSNVSWILTETGEVVSYVDYVWGEHYRWDNSFRWTSNDKVLESNTYNLGRKIDDKEG